jgi:uncharacterized membrane protein (DUF106 family)
MKSKSLLSMLPPDIDPDEDKQLEMTLMHDRDEREASKVAIDEEQVKQKELLEKKRKTELDILDREKPEVELGNHQQLTSRGKKIIAAFFTAILVFTWFA